ncbi:ubiquitin-associated domain-containing protein 2 isoform X2 [Coregonus clupeaformis]|uniref:ubiquitin-associated domain-containing protein 2 isoform X2 n=1 Tax=Coregonus clupeaformis TaxID=59861 RepID=UPI001E1C95BB|nr:ubiquitin-associated domain-containing protein 2 isoform X2 [Coregonus clupeaformis]
MLASVQYPLTCLWEDKAPLSKGLLLVLSGLTVVLTLLPQYHHLFTYSLQAITQQQQVWRLVCGRLICLDLKDTFCNSLLIYNFRIFERRFGSRKFASFLFGTWVLTALMDFLLAEAFHYLFDYQVAELPAGLLGPVFSLFVPFYSSIPKVPVTQLLGQISITNKSLVYIVGLQLLTSSPYMWLVALSGLISGKLYHSNALRVQRLLFVPRWLSRVGAFLLEPLFSGLPPPNDTPLGMGATLDIQRQQRMDLHDQQMLLAQFNQARRNHRPPQDGLMNWNRFFPSLRHRGQNLPPEPQPHPSPQQPHPSSPLQPHPSPQQPHPTPQQLHPTAPPLQLAPTAPPLDNTLVAEEQVARLMEMGFSRIDAQDALRASNNDINVATNFLLQHLG